MNTFSRSKKVLIFFLICTIKYTRISLIDGTLSDYSLFFISELNDDKFLKIFNEKFFRYFKFYVENKEGLEMICLRTVADYARETEYPKGELRFTL